MTAITPDTSLTKTPLLTLLSLSQQSTQLETLVTWSPVSVALDDIISKMKEIIGPEILQWGYINVRLMQGCIEKDLLPLIPFHAIIPLKISFDQRNRIWIICHVHCASKRLFIPLGKCCISCSDKILWTHWSPETLTGRKSAVSPGPLKLTQVLKLREVSHISLITRSNRKMLEN